MIRLILVSLSLITLLSTVSAGDLFYLDASMGAALSKISSDGDLKYVFEPTNDVHSLTSYSFALEGGINLTKFFGIFTGLRFGQLGQYTNECNVKFITDPAVHTLSSRTELLYISFPVNARLQFWFHSNSIGLRFGPVVKHLISSRIRWRLDNSDIDMEQDYNYISNNFSPVPAVSVSENSIDLLGGLEYLYRFSNYGILISACGEWGLTNLINGEIGLGGDAYTRAMYLELGFRRYF